MNKKVLIRNNLKSRWVSCQSITDNLEESYNKSGNYLTKYYNISDSKWDNFKLANEIIEDAPSEIIFIDHKPHPITLLQILNQLAPDYSPLIKFHIYGDFILNSHLWNELQTILKNYKVEFICASHKQALLIEDLTNNNQPINVIPFPINENTFYYDENIREQKRNELGHSSDDFIFLYTGRISQQKNLIELVKIMQNCISISGDNTYFYFAGPFDDIGIPYKGQENPEGAYFHRLQHICKDIKHNQIRYIGNTGPQELRSYYNAADRYISLSTHNDEDYGMAPAEALMCGLPSLLTDWGGFSSFFKYLKNDVELIPVIEDKDRYIANPSRAQKLIYKSLMRTYNNNEREDLAKNAKKFLSIDSVSHNLKDYKCITNNKFDGFNKRLTKLASIFTLNPKQPFLGPANTYTDFYYEVYKSYLKEDL